MSGEHMIKKLLIFGMFLGLCVLLWARLNSRSVQLDQAVKTEQSLISHLETNGVGEVRATGLSGESFVFPGKATGPFVLHFWATWCGPCVSEIPSIAKLSKMKPNFQIWAVSADDSKDAVVKFLNSFAEVSDGNLKIAIDLDRQLSNEFMVAKLPETFIFGKDGKLKRRIVGATEWMRPEVIKYLEEVEREP